MEEIASDLTILGYNGLIPKKFEMGDPDSEFAEVITWLSLQLTAVYSLENLITSLSDTKDLLGFAVEISCFLKELNCPYRSLTSGDVTERLSSSSGKQLLLRFLATELQTARILAAKKIQPLKSMQIELEESSIAKELKKTLICLKFGKPPESITPRQLFQEVEKKLKALSLPSTPKEKVGELLFSGYLTEKQWFHLNSLFKDMSVEYATRRNLLMNRLDVTVKSFLWAAGLKGKGQDIMSNYAQRKAGLLVKPELKVSHILSAKSGLAVVEKTSSASVRKSTQSSITKVVIGSVPDRGGRPEEQQPPPPEVPSWQTNPSSGSQSGNYKNAANDNRNKFSNASRGSHYRDNPTRDRNHTSAVQGQPVYQPMNHAYVPNQQLQFGGYAPAGDNFHQYGVPVNYQQDSQSMNQGRGGYQRGSNYSRGGSSNRGYNPRGGFRGRGNRY